MLEPKIYKKRIDQIYLDAIKAGKKNHEYRLNIPPLKDCCVGDKLVLISNETNDYVECYILGKETFESFDAAIEKYFALDFSDIFNDEQEAIDACSKFYDSEDVRKFGILVLEIGLTKKR